MNCKCNELSVHYRLKVEDVVRGEDYGLPDLRFATFQVNKPDGSIVPSFACKSYVILTFQAILARIQQIKKPTILPVDRARDWDRS